MRTLDLIWLSPGVTPASSERSKGRGESVLALPESADGERLVRKGGIEPPWSNDHRLLRPARLPIPPLSRSSGDRDSRLRVVECQSANRYSLERSRKATILTCGTPFENFPCSRPKPRPRYWSAPNLLPFRRRKTSLPRSGTSRTR